MSGRAKRIVYVVLSCIFGLGACAAAVCMALPAVKQPTAADIVAIFCVALCVILRIPAVIHELGHLLFGYIAGMKCVSITLSYLRISSGKVKFADPAYAGSIEAYPKSGRHVRGRLIALTLGGIAANLLVGGALLLMYFLLPYQPAPLFCGMLAPFMLYEGISAALPAELSAGKTDGAVALGTIKKAPEEEVMLRVLTAQGVLCRGGYRDIPRSLLFDVPVVREDLPAFAQLLTLRIGYLLEQGERGEAEASLSRLDEIGEIPGQISDEATRFRAALKGTEGDAHQQP